MRTWRSPMSAASQGAFVVIQEISERYFLNNNDAIIKVDTERQKTITPTVKIRVV